MICKPLWGKRITVTTMFVWFLKCLLFCHVADNICSHHALAHQASKTDNYSRDRQDKACSNISANALPCKHKSLVLLFIGTLLNLVFQLPERQSPTIFLLSFQKIPLPAPLPKKKKKKKITMTSSFYAFMRRKHPYSVKKWQNPRSGRD